jgi:hypothetical protein
MCIQFADAFQPNINRYHPFNLPVPSFFSEKNAKKNFAKCNFFSHYHNVWQIRREARICELGQAQLKVQSYNPFPVFKERQTSK